MPGKWTDQAERDLIFAVLASHTGGDLKVKVSWDTVKDQMHAWGHTDFTKEAINQRWSKTIVKDFKEGKGDDSFGASAAAKDTASGGTPAGRKRKTATPRKTPKPAVEGDDDDDGDEAEKEAGDEPKPKKPAAPAPKKRKPSAKNTPKAEPKAEPEPKKEPKKEAQSVSIFGSGGVKRETTDDEV